MYCEMITTIDSTNIYLSSHIDTIKRKKKRIKEKKFSPNHSLRIYSLNSFTIYYTELLAIVIMLYIISIVPIYLITVSLYFLTTLL